MRHIAWPSNYCSVSPRHAAQSPSYHSNSHRRKEVVTRESYDEGRKYHRSPDYRGSYKKSLRDHRS